MNDRNFNTLEIGDDVVVYPNDFLATVIDIKQDSDDEYYAVVTDQDDNVFDVESDNIELA
jgi:hypothetical protein